MKRCCTCGQDLPIEAFNKNAAMKDGFCGYCKECRKTFLARYRLTTRFKASASRRNARYHATEKGRAVNRRAVAKFNKSDKGLMAKRLWRQTPKGREEYRRQVEVNRAHPERVAARHQRWYAKPKSKDIAFAINGRRRVHEAEAYVEDVSRSVVWERDNGTCWICKLTVALKEMHIDHVIPVSKGGKHCYANCRTAHPRCNLRKKDKLPSELGLNP